MAKLATLTVNISIGHGDSSIAFLARYHAAIEERETKIRVVLQDDERAEEIFRQLKKSGAYYLPALDDFLKALLFAEELEKQLAEINSLTADDVR